jgi:hypothetical protein
MHAKEPQTKLEFNFLQQGFSTGVPRNPRVPREIVIDTK